MAKAKFKIGQLLRHQDDDLVVCYGEVEAVVTRSDSYAYRLDNGAEVTEDKVSQAYKPLTVARKTRRKRKNLEE